MKRKTIFAAILILVMAIGVLILPLAIRAAPSVDAGQNRTIYEGQQMTFNGTASLDNASIVSINWNFGDGSTVNGSNPTLLNTTTHTYQKSGVYTVTLTVKFDSKYNITKTDTVTITVVTNQPPVANAGPDQIVEQTSPAGAEVVLNASRSYDPNNDTLTYYWKWSGGSATGVTPTVVFPLGTTNVTLTVSDGMLNATDTVVIKVVDTTPPTITVSVSPDDLWPPNHKYVEVTTTVTVHDICDPSPKITLVSVTSNEPDNANGIGDGNTTDDIVIVVNTNVIGDNFTFNVRAERAGNGSGRIYTITYRATDASGNSAQASATVTVNHS